MRDIIKKYKYVIIATVSLLIITLIIIIGISRSSRKSNSQEVNDQTTQTSNQNSEDSSASNSSDGNTNASSSTNQNEKPNPINITNFDTVVKNLPSTERATLETILASTIKQNTSANITLTSVKDATIRDGTYVQNYDSQKYVYSTQFIVDIPSLKQSYKITDKYSPLPPEQSGLFDYTQLVLCPSQDELIYGSFNCKDRMSTERGE